MLLQDSNSKTGYMLIYGSNADVGGYQIQGSVGKDETGTITYDMKYTFNDIMDPNFRYSSETTNYNVLKLLKKINNSITMNNYNLSIACQDKTKFYIDGGLNAGWLANMELVDFKNKFNGINEAFDLMELNWWNRGDKDSMLLTQKNYTEMQNFMVEHPEYYGCFID